MHILIQWWSNVGTWCFRIGWEYTFTSVWDLEGWLQVSGSHYIWYTRYTNEPHYPGVSVSRAGQGVSVRTGTATQGWCAEYYSPGPHYVALCCRCELHGQCKNGTCLCVTGWNGRHCTIQGCPSMCSDHGRCTTGHFSLPGAGALTGKYSLWSYSLFLLRSLLNVTHGAGDWRCECELGWDGADCATRLETQCGDGLDNDGGEMTACNNVTDPVCHTVIHLHYAPLIATIWLKLHLIFNLDHIQCNFPSFECFKSDVYLKNEFLWTIFFLLTQLCYSIIVEVP